jgi:hypothetical protein
MRYVPVTVKTVAVGEVADLKGGLDSFDVAIDTILLDDF